MPWKTDVQEQLKKKKEQEEMNKQGRLVLDFSGIETDVKRVPVKSQYDALKRRFAQR